MNPNASRIIDIANAFYNSCVLFAAIDLGIFDALAILKKANAVTVSKQCSLNPRGAILLLDACAALDLIIKEDDMYTNTPDSAFFLVPGSPGNLSQAIVYNRDVYPVWGQIAEMVKTGKPVERPSIHLGNDKDRTRNFVLAMHGRAMWMGQIIIPFINLEGCKQLLDVGGGPGTYSVLLAKKYPELECTVFDLPGVVSIAKQLIESQGMSERVSICAGNYHTADFPWENDTVLFFGMLHQESPDDISTLFRKAYAALKPGGKVWIMDMMTNKSHIKPVFSALFAVNMALTTENGWVFSDAELKGWLESAGFRNFQVKQFPKPMMHWLAWAEKPVV
ncbi:MAG: methyltransferase domain-containing protein [Spirochaetales bacterium]|nr:methyltransferase domain-containing protein [Spirochaetales bacterium]